MRRRIDKFYWRKYIIPRPKGRGVFLGGDNADLSCSSAINSSRMICAEFSREIALEVFENDVMALGKQHGLVFEADVRFFKRLPRARNFRRSHIAPQFVVAQNEIKVVPVSWFSPIEERRYFPSRESFAADVGERVGREKIAGYGGDFSPFFPAPQGHFKFHLFIKPVRLIREDAEVSARGFFRFDDIHAEPRLFKLADSADERFLDCAR